MPPPNALGGAQRRYLRGLANTRKPLVHVGEAGITEGVLGALARALLDHELVKVRLREPEDKKASARELAARSGAELCGLVGHTVILYKPHPEEPVIELPPASQSPQSRGSA